MKEIEEIITSYDQAVKTGRQTALATVVHVEGSSYRRAGARMLITEDGQLTGAISGGCLEGDALRKARLAMIKKEAMLVTYDTTDDDDAKLGVGLGCNGIIQILIEPILPGEENAIMFLKHFLTARRPAVLVTLFNMRDRQGKQLGTCILLPENGEAIGGIPDENLSLEIIRDAREVFGQADNSVKRYLYENEHTCFLELLRPAISIVIVGAGNDALPVVKMAKILGWRVTIADGRSNYLTIDRFSTADRLIVAKPDELLGYLDIDDRTVFVLMTHNYNYDIAVLRTLTDRHLPYIGVLGPKKRLIRLMGEIQSNEDEPVIPQNIHGPVGFDLGAETAEEIALSIIAEIQAVINKRDGIPLQHKTYVHDRVHAVSF